MPSPTKPLAPPTLPAALDAAETVGSLLELAGRLDELLGHLPDDPAIRQVVARLQATRRQADREAQRVIAYLRAAQDAAAPTETHPRSPLARRAPPPPAPAAGHVGRPLRHHAEGTVSAAPKQARGWGWPLNSRKAHYFVGSRSLCGAWAFLGDLTANEAHGPDDCASCVKRLAGMRAKQSKAGAS